MQQIFFTLSEYNEILKNQPVSDENSFMSAKKHNSQLTKPEGSLGKLETLALFFAGWQGVSKPKLDKVQIAIFAGNHGVTANFDISKFPAEVTEQMVFNFRAGGAAINQLSSVCGAKMDVYALDLDIPTADFTKTSAMTEAELLKSLQIGWNSVDPSSDLFIAGEMGIGNTTSAAAIAAALFGGGGKDWVGRGTGVDDTGLKVKSDVVDAGLVRHKKDLDDPLSVLRVLGGREIAAMVGAIASARAHSIPVLLDGFICSAAAAVLYKMNHCALDHTQAGHVSAEGAHAQMLSKLGKKPLLMLGLRLGEGSGAALAINIVKSAVACLSGMATFAEAKVSTKT